MSSVAIWLPVWMISTLILVFLALKIPKWYRQFKLSSYHNLNTVRSARQKVMSKANEKLDREAEDEIMKIGDYLIRDGAARSSNEKVLNWYREAGYKVTHEYGTSYLIVIPPVSEKEVNDIMMES